MFTLGFLSGSYFSGVFVYMYIISIIAECEPYKTRLLESLFWFYHIARLMFGKDEEE
jgi:hypothetical protein